MSKLVLPKLSFKIMGILFRVHNELGPSLLEKYYQRAIEQELKKNKLKFKREVPIKLFYEEKKIGRYFLDFTILPLAIVANFRRTKIRYKRIINPHFKNTDLSDRDYASE